MNTIAIEDKYAIPFFNKLQVSIERGEGVYVWDESGRKYLDFTSGWGVTCIGHANPVITRAICDQAEKIIQNPSSGLTYSPARAKLLELLSSVLPGRLQKVFFSNSGAEANDAAIKLARKVSGRTDIISTHKSFHGRTISAASATGQAKHREKFNPLMPNYRFVPYNDLDALAESLDDRVAAVILEPIQGEGGVNISPQAYLKNVSALCEKNGSYLIMDEVQTGFCRTGPMFAIDGLDIKVDFMTMAKGIAGGFPIGAFAVSAEIADGIEMGDHGGTYCGNPLGTAVSYAVIKYLLDNRISEHVETISAAVFEELYRWQRAFGDIIADVRGRGLLIAIEFYKAADANAIYLQCLEQGLFINITQEKVIRLFPALNITPDEMKEGLQILENIVAGVVTT
ncbi:MAG: aminotransferase class III-fold pyridoxal phosphate-dependent enzyme [Deltaproteobacteria bacterium]|nr:aminotransferase class III-fold pyridoxal phosphate-dependent enzyme [Deltaproteobacteria bacterium]